MIKTLKISFSLKSTYETNSTINSLQSVPVINKLLPNSLYSNRNIKILANILTFIKEIVILFSTKILYFMFVVITFVNYY
ncbi:MAG: hypothetical protein RR435_02550, partial [Erysipelotrichaceae bacterium]